ncbi:myoneurin-like [Thrips palmi]|uniref:Myoneurin-like n=1 Tax=Thrips palmi TaxID=161013 RepID=A0A6P8Z5Z7_THRPL|nr:myoneurin-like [Thrips palmi]
MQSSTGPLRCAECNDDFSSAASLLTHFAQHIVIAESASPIEASSSSTTTKKKKSDSILEQILQRTTKRAVPKKAVHRAGTGPPMLLPINQSHLVSKSNTPLLEFLKKNVESAINQDQLHLDAKDQSDTLLNQSSCCSSASSSSSANGNIDTQLLSSKIFNGASINLAKFDMQQRIENCVLNLVSKKDVKRSADALIPDMPPTIPNKKVYSDTCESWDSSSAAEEINPLTLCTVTIDDCENGTDSDEIRFDHSKKNSNRKQLAPKKISRPDNDMLHELSSKLPEHTTLTTVECPSPEREKHGSKKKYPCHICSKVFGWSTDLKRHILIHTGERPFKCKLCPSSFTRNFLLQKHESKVHHRNGAKCVVNGQLEAIALKLQSTEHKDSFISLLPNLDIPYDISSKPLNDTEEISEDDPELEGDDRSSADENDNHNQKLKNISLEMQDPCRVKQPWHPTNLAQQALQ